MPWDIDVSNCYVTKKDLLRMILLYATAFPLSSMFSLTLEQPNSPRHYLARRISEIEVRRHPTDSFPHIYEM